MTTEKLGLRATLQKALWAMRENLGAIQEVADDQLDPAASNEVTEYVEAIMEVYDEIVSAYERETGTPLY